MTLDLPSWKLKRICGCDWEHILLSKLILCRRVT